MIQDYSMKGRVIFFVSEVKPSGLDDGDNEIFFTILIISVEMRRWQDIYFLIICASIVRYAVEIA